MFKNKIWSVFLAIIQCNARSLCGNCFMDTYEQRERNEVLTSAFQTGFSKDMEFELGPGGWAGLQRRYPTSRKGVLRHVDGHSGHCKSGRTHRAAAEAVGGGE